jgi:hypothetical protein
MGTAIDKETVQTIVGVRDSLDKRAFDVTRFVNQPPQ